MAKKLLYGDVKMEKNKQNQSIEHLSTVLLEILESKGYSLGSLINYRRILSVISEFMKKRKIADYTKSVGDFFFAEYIANNPSVIQHKQRIKTTLRRLDELNNGSGFRLKKQSPEASSPPQFSKLLETYMKFCTSIGFKENTIAKKRKFCRDFLSDIAEAGCMNVSEINAKYVCKAILRTSNKDSYAAICSFLQHLYEKGIINNDLSRIIPKYRRFIPLPTIYTDDEINRLEGIVNKVTKKGKRGYAIILFASRLGMRAGDIAGLTFDNIDFNRDSINIIQKKTGQPLSLPLLPEIRQALTDYIQHARPNVDSNYLFLRTYAPFGNISTAIINHTLAENFKVAGIDISNKKHGPHTLRSSMATSMVNSDVPYDVVRKALGHTSPQSIKYYAKVDIDNLRFYAIDVPAPSGLFAMVLQGRDKSC